MIALTKQTNDVIAVLPAAGIGKRMQTNIPKQYLTIGSKTLLEHAIEALLRHPCVNEAVVAISAEDCWFHRLPVATDSRIHVVTGGSMRTDSVMAALRHTRATSWVLVHDVARPCLHQDDLHRLLAITAYTKIGGLLATPVRDTIKRVHAGSNIIFKTVARDDLWHALTPQLFARDLLITCLERTLVEGIAITDEASALEYCGYAPMLVPGRADNIKITSPEDLALANFFFSQLSTQKTYKCVLDMV